MRLVRFIGLLAIVLSQGLSANVQDSLIYRLKADYARSMGLDTMPQVRQEIATYRRHLSALYLVDDKVLESKARKMYDIFRASHTAGKVWLLQVYRDLPQNITSSQLNEVNVQMDSIYQAVRQGSLFEDMVSRYSEVKDTLRVDWLQMPTEFEDKVFGMKPGEYSSPFYTPQGIHMVKVIKRDDALPFDSVKGYLIQQLRQQFSDVYGTVQVDYLKRIHHFESNDENCKELLRRGTTDRVLFTLDGKEYSGIDFGVFAATYSFGVSRQLNAYILKSLVELEDQSLELQHLEMEDSLERYESEILVKLATEYEVIAPSHDEMFLKEFFDNHRDNYQWETPRFKGIVIHAKNKKTLKRARKLLKSIPFELWEDALNQAYGGQFPPTLSWSQGFFAPGDNIYVDDKFFKVTKANPMDDFPRFDVYGKKIKKPEDFRAVPHEKLVADCQAFLESQWVERLKSQK